MLPTTAPDLSFDFSSGPAAAEYVPRLDCYLVPDDKVHDGILVCPGGGYRMISLHEGASIAQRFRQAGLHAFVLTYSIAPARFPQSLREAATSMRMVRAKSRQLRLNPGRVAMIGFSAGGHLAASMTILSGDRVARSDNPALQDFSCRPDALILSYAVLTAGEYSHRDSFDQLLGEKAYSSVREELSLERRVTAAMPPVFLWHTVDDQTVPVENSLLFAEALRDAKVPFELHIFPNGYHGIALAQNMPHVTVWFDLCLTWLGRLEFGVVGCG